MKTLKKKIEERIKEIDKDSYQHPSNKAAALRVLKQVLTWIEEYETQPKTILENSLLKKAIEDYPIGTKFKDMFCKREEIVIGIPKWGNHNSIDSSGNCLYYNNQWAQIISKPEIIEPKEEMVLVPKSKLKKIHNQIAKGQYSSIDFEHMLGFDIMESVYSSSKLKDYQDVLDSHEHKEVYFINNKGNIGICYPDTTEPNSHYYVTQQRAEQVKQLIKLLFIADTVCINPVQIYIKFTNESEGEVKRILGNDNYNKALGI